MEYPRSFSLFSEKIISLSFALQLVVSTSPTPGVIQHIQYNPVEQFYIHWALFPKEIPHRIVATLLQTYH